MRPDAGEFGYRFAERYQQGQHLARDAKGCIASGTCGLLSSAVIESRWSPRLLVHIVTVQIEWAERAKQTVRRCEEGCLPTKNANPVT
mmetsp:Transcript_12741/g.35320  ORF Transcript_12741/g.35320 Transcript_12741/m.35320 type:complete len:88 (-) Transcript_12741:8-271(-)